MVPETDFLRRAARRKCLNVSRNGMRTTSNLIRLIFLFVILLTGLNAFGQEDTTKIKIDTKSETIQKQIQEDAEKINQLTSAVQDLKTQNAVLTKSLDTLTLIFGFFAGLISVVLLVGTITSFISWNTDRRRSSETYYLAHQKEKESSERDRSVFLQSTETLTLVNQTLKLAKDASERASNALAEKLNKKHNDLEQDAIDLIEESKACKNFKVLVEDSNFRSNLLTLALEITGLQHNQNILEKETALNPHCSFIRGMEYHLSQHFKTAIKYWKQAKDHKDAPDSLKIMSLYWIGYEQNNLKDFENATSNFEIASSIAKGAMKYELERIKIESKFFDFPKYTPDKLLPEIETLYEAIKKETVTEEFLKVRSNIGGTLGNIYYQLGNTSNEEKAKEYYKKAKSIFVSYGKNTTYENITINWKGKMYTNRTQTRLFSKMMLS